MTYCREVQSVVGLDRCNVDIPWLNAGHGRIKLTLLEPWKIAE